MTFWKEYYLYMYPLSNPFLITLKCIIKKINKVNYVGVEVMTAILHEINIIIFCCPLEH